MFWFNRKYKKISAEDIQNAVVELEKKNNAVIEEIDRIDTKIKSLYEKGAAEPRQQTQLYYAKQIKMYEDQQNLQYQNSNFLMYNITTLNKLKIAIESGKAIKDFKSVSLNKLLNKPQQLADYLKKITGERIRTENTMKEASEMLDEQAEFYGEDDEIYGVNKREYDILSIFNKKADMKIEEKVFSKSGVDVNQEGEENE